MQEQGLFQYFFLHIRAVLDSFMDSQYQTLVDSFRPLAISILTIYILTGAIKIFTGHAEKPKEMMWTAFTASVIVGIVFSYDAYKNWLLDPLIDTSMKLMGFILSSSSGLNSAGLVFNNIDYHFAILFEALRDISKDASLWDGAHIFIVTFLLALLYGALYIVFSFMIIFALFAMYIFFVIGGIPLFLAIMPSTRFVFWAWLRGIANYALIPVFAALVMGVTLNALSAIILDLANQKVALSGEYDVWNYNVASAFFMGLLSIFFLFKCSEFAAALTGGQPSSASAFMGSMVSLGAMSTIPAARALAPKIATAGRYGAKYGGQALGAAGRGIADGASRVADGASRAYSALKGIFNKKGD
ncbi:MAG: type IV secretion system protein [Helicobacteraceae bacterium]|jgi:hypothetical protein|nr:type IV secretion system protein [Helicobacteraceae bacterium]